MALDSWESIISDPDYNSLNEQQKYQLAIKYKQKGGVIPEQYGEYGNMTPWEQLIQDPDYQKLGNGEKVDLQKKYIQKGGYVPTWGEHGQAENALDAVGAIVAPVVMRTANWFHKDDGKKFFSDEDIQKAELQDPTARAIGNTAMGIASWELGAAAVPEISVGAGLTKASRIATKVANFTADNLGGSLSSQIAVNGKITPENTAIDLGISGAIEGGLQVPKLWRINPDIAVSAAKAEQYGERQASVIRNAKKDTYTATANSGTLAKLWKSLKEQYPTIMYDEVLATWADKKPVMNEITEGNTESQIERLSRVLFPEGVPSDLTTEALLQSIRTTKGRTLNMLEKTKLSDGETGSRIAIKAIKEMRKAGFIPPNINSLKNDAISSELGYTNFGFDSILEWIESLSGVTPALRKNVANKAITSVLSDTKKLVDERLSELYEINDQLISNTPKGDSEDSILHNSELEAYNYKIQHLQNVKKKLNSMTGFRKVNPDVFDNLISEAQDLIYKGGDASAISDVVENLQIIDMINQLKKSESAPLTFKLLMMKIGATIPLAPISMIKLVRDSSRVRASTMGSELYQEYEASKWTTKELIDQIKELEKEGIDASDLYKQLDSLSEYNDLEDFIRNRIKQKYVKPNYKGRLLGEALKLSTASATKSNSK